MFFPLTLHKSHNFFFGSQIIQFLKFTFLLTTKFLHFCCVRWFIVTLQPILLVFNRYTFNNHWNFSSPKSLPTLKLTSPNYCLILYSIPLLGYQWNHTVNYIRFINPLQTSMSQFLRLKKKLLPSIISYSSRRYYEYNIIPGPFVTFIFFLPY